MEKLLTFNEAMGRLYMTSSKLRQWVFRRKIDVVRIGRKIMIPESAVEKILTEGFCPAIKKEESNED